MGSTVPGIDAGARQRLTAPFGSEAEAWFGELPGVLTALAQRWQLELGSPLPRGSVSAVYWCRMADGRRAVLKASPDRARLAFEAAALSAWHTVHTPAAIALDEQLGALLLEAVEPGTPLDLSAIYPAADSVAELLSSLHGSGVPDPSYPAAAQRVAYLFGSSAKLYERHPQLTALIPPELYERGTGSRPGEQAGENVGRGSRRGAPPCAGGHEVGLGDFLADSPFPVRLGCAQC